MIKVEEGICVGIPYEYVIETMKKSEDLRSDIMSLYNEDCFYGQISCDIAHALNMCLRRGSPVQGVSYNVTLIDEDITYSPTDNVMLLIGNILYNFTTNETLGKSFRSKTNVSADEFENIKIRSTPSNTSFIVRDLIIEKYEDLYIRREVR